MCYSRIPPQVDEIQRLRVEKMERQLANLTGLVQKALQVPGPSGAPAAAPRQEFPLYQGRPTPQGNTSIIELTSKNYSTNLLPSID